MSFLCTKTDISRKIKKLIGMSRKGGILRVLTSQILSRESPAEAIRNPPANDQGASEEGRRKIPDAQDRDNIYICSNYDDSSLLSRFHILYHKNRRDWIIRRESCGRQNKKR